MTILAQRGSGTPTTTGTTWASLTNAVDGAAGSNPATYATYTNAVSAAVATITVTGYGFDSVIGASDTLNSVTVTLRHFENNTGRFASVRFQPFDGATAIGTQFTAVLATGARNDTTTFPVTLAQIRSSTFKMVVTITGAASTQSRVFSIDQVDVTADYTPAPPAVTQAAYRFYADGTETGSTALANQDTGYTADTSGGDVNLGVRMRLQSTSAVAVPATDDWQLQSEKNTSGTWAAVTAPGVVLADSYPATGRDTALWLTSVAPEVAQSFLSNGQLLKQVKWYLGDKLGTPTGTLAAVLYAHSGTFGAAGSIPTGSALATSSTVLAATVPGTAYAWFSFDFDGSFQLVNGIPYFIGLKASGAAAASNGPAAGCQTSGSTHPGRGAIEGGGWASGTSRDLMFELYTLAPSVPVLPYDSASLTDGAATTNRLGAGSGSFVAGKVSEDGLVDNLGWTANNYTELLYSVTLKQADLTPSDTLRFRVVKNGSTADLTYSQTPTITIGTAGPQTINGTAVVSVAVTAVAVGTVVAEVITGTAVASFALDVTATGTVVAPGAIVTGIASTSVAVAAVATGTVVAEVVTGTATASLAINVAASGTVVAEVVTGTATSAVTITVTATGTVVAEVITGTAVASFAITAVAVGTVIAEVVTGTAVSSVALTSTTTGTRVVGGTSVVPIALTVTAAGVTAGAVTGTVTSTVALTVVAIGKRVVVGTASAQVAFATVTVGTRVVRGASVVPVAFATVAVGTIVGAPITATASSAIAFVVVAVGTVESGMVGQWNGQTVTAMQWGSQPVEAFTLT